MPDRMHPRDRFRRGEYNHLEKEWVRDVENSVLEKQRRRRSHRVTEERGEIRAEG